MCKNKVYDHLGNEYASKIEMVRHYGFHDAKIFYWRIGKGWSLKDALTIPSKQTWSAVVDWQSVCSGKNGCCIDHLENYYACFRSMCDCWHICESTVKRRLKSGLSLESALTLRNTTQAPDKDTTVIWVFGEPFPSYRAIDTYYGFSPSVSHQHREDLEGWLLSKSMFYVDGTLYRSISSLAMAYGFTYSCLSHRLHGGMPVQEAVSKPTNRVVQPKACADHIGNVYDCEADMLVAYGVTPSAYRCRIRKGWSQKEALITPMKKYLDRK